MGNWRWVLNDPIRVLRYIKENHLTIICAKTERSSIRNTKINERFRLWDLIDPKEGFQIKLWTTEDGSWNMPKKYHLTIICAKTERSSILLDPNEGFPN